MPYIRPNITLSIVPAQTFKNSGGGGENLEPLIRNCITAVLTRIAHRLNVSAHTGANNYFNQLIEQIARRRTTECCSKRYNMLFIKRRDDVTEEKSASVCFHKGNGNYHNYHERDWRFPTLAEMSIPSLEKKPCVPEDIILAGCYFLVEYPGFAVRKSIAGMELAELWFDRMFVAVRMFRNDKRNCAEHVCTLFTPQSQIIARDLATTSVLELLHQRDSASYDGVMKPTFTVSTS